MSKRKEIDILDLIPPEGVTEVDRVGYQLLAEHGYDVSGASSDVRKRTALLKALKANGDELIYTGQIDAESRKIRIRYSLYRNKKLLSQKAVEFIPIKEDADGKDRADKEGPTENT